MIIGMLLLWQMSCRHVYVGRTHGPWHTESPGLAECPQGKPTTRVQTGFCKLQVERSVLSVMTRMKLEKLPSQSPREIGLRFFSPRLKSEGLSARVFATNIWPPGMPLAAWCLRKSPACRALGCDSVVSFCPGKGIAPQKDTILEHVEFGHLATFCNTTRST